MLGPALKAHTSFTRHLSIAVSLPLRSTVGSPRCCDTLCAVTELTRSHPSWN